MLEADPHYSRRSLFLIDQNVESVMRNIASDSWRQEDAQFRLPDSYGGEFHVVKADRASKSCKLIGES